MNVSQPSAAPDVDTRLRLFLVAALLGLYLLVYVNVPDSADGKAVLAVAASTVQQGRPTMESVAGSDGLLPPLARLGKFGPDGALYAKKGPVQSLALLPLVALAEWLPWLSIRATAMLLNPLVTALTAGLLYTLVRRLGYRPTTALALGLVFGVATLAVVYVKTLFGEPLVGLLLVIALLAALDFRQDRRWRVLALCGMALGLAVGINVLYVLLIPPVAVYLFWPLRLSRRAIVDMAWFITPLVGIALLLGGYNWARFGSPLDSGYHFADGEGFVQPLAAGLFGLVLSPYRGFFPYNPVLLLAIPGWLMLRRRAPGLAWTALALWLVQALGFASWWSWHGGIVWGPRFLLPAVPLAVLCLAPLVEAARTRRYLIIVLGGFAALSAAVQALGALYSYFPYIGYLYSRYEVPTYFSLASGLADEVVFNPTLSPILGHMALVAARWPLEPTWTLGGGDWIHLMAAALVICAGISVLIARRWLTPRRSRLLVALVSLFSLNVVVARQQFAPQNNAGAIRELQTALTTPGTVVAATLLFDDALLDLKTGWPVLTTNAPTRLDDDYTRRLWEWARGQGRRLWFVTWFGPADERNWQEWQLWEEASFVGERWVGKHRVLQFDLGPGAAANQPGGWRFGTEIRLEAYGLLRAEDGLYMTLRWSPQGPVAGDRRWFVHLLDAGGQIVLQQDRAPQGGYPQASGWLAGTPVTDRLFFPVPKGSDTGGWRVRVGWVDAAGQPVPVFDPEGQVLPERSVVLDLPGSK